MGDWMTLAAAHILVGFEICVLGMIGSGGDDGAQACLIIGMLCYLVTVILMVLMKAGGLGGNQAAKISACVLIFVAAFMVLVGAAIWGDETNNLAAGTSPYNFTLDITASVMALIAGIFLCLDLTGGGGGGSSSGSSGGSKSKKNKTGPKKGASKA